MLWLLIGSFLDIVHRRKWPRRAGSGWDYVATSGLYAFITFVLALFGKSILKVNATAMALRSSLSASLAFNCENFGLYALGVFFALLWAALTMNGRYGSMVWRVFSSQDPYMTFVQKAMRPGHSYAIVTLTSGKVYVGAICGATIDPDEDHRCIQILVSLSGYRNDQRQVVFDKNYLDKQNHSSFGPLVIPYSQVATMGPFDFDLHKRFVDEGVTILEPSESKDEATDRASVRPEQPGGLSSD